MLLQCKGNYFSAKQLYHATFLIKFVHLQNISSYHLAIKYKIQFYFLTYPKC